MDGDGFLDFLRAGNAHYARNTGSELVSTPWQMESQADADPVSNPPGETDEAEEAEQQRIYYRQEPLRRWKAYRSGTLEVRQAARLNLPEAASQDGLVLRTYNAAGEKALILDRMHPVGVDVTRYSVQENGSLYFRMDTGEQESGDDAEWSVRLRYIAADFFGHLKQGALFQPVENSVGAPPYGGDPRLLPIYRQGLQRIDGQEVIVYTLRQDWQGLEQEVLTPACEALVEHGEFVPRQLSRELMEKLYAAASEHADETLAVPDPAGSGASVSVSLPRLLLEGFGYTAERRVFQRLNDYGDVVAKRFLPSLSLQERRQAALIPWFDGLLVAPRQDADGLSYTAANPALSLEAALFSSRDAATPGCTVLGAGILLDELWEKAEDAEPAERLWLRRDAERAWRLYRLDEAGEAECSLIAIGVDPVEVRYADSGVERRFRLSGKTSLLARLPVAVYDGAVSDEVLRGEVFEHGGLQPDPGGGLGRDPGRL